MISARLATSWPRSLHESVRQDTVAELTNMIGGNIKSLFPGSSHLSLPTVTDGTDFRLHWCNSSVISETAYQWDKHLFSVVVLVKDQ